MNGQGIEPVSNILCYIKKSQLFCYLNISTNNHYINKSAGEQTILCPWYKRCAHIYLVIRDLI